jgi:hypothetical protein
MALQKTKVSPSGASGNYWCIKAVNCDPDAGTAILVIYLYVDSAACVAGKEQLEIFSVDLGSYFYDWEYASGDADMGSMIMVAAHKALKNLAIAHVAGDNDNADLAFFSDATEV